jgi:hypothetical protein
MFTCFLFIRLLGLLVKKKIIATIFFYYNFQTLYFIYFRMFEEFKHLIQLCLIKSIKMFANEEEKMNKKFRAQSSHYQQFDVSNYDRIIVSIH